MLCYASFGVCALLFLRVSLRPTHSIAPIYAVLVLLGVVRSLNGPVSRALLPHLVREEHFQNAVAWHSTIFQVGTILGPSVGGLIYALFGGPTAVYATALACYITAVACTVGIRFQEKTRDREPISLQTVLAGLAYIWKQKVVLGSISLDLFAVLLGGAVALLPAYAQDILHTGPWGLGLLRSAGRGRGQYGDSAGVPAVAAARGYDDVVVRRGVRNFYHRVRAFPQPDAVIDCAGANGRGGHGQRGDSGDAGAGGDSRSDARARERRGHDFYWCVE